MTSVMKEFEHLKIPLEEIKKATNGFSSKVIGKGGFGKVYEGEVSHARGRSFVAIKRLNHQLGEGDPGFMKEIMMLSRYAHKNLVPLLGYCDEDGEKILVYEHASNGSLDRHLSSTVLTWTKRLKICLDVARGLAYLHDHKGTQQRVLHRDIKSANILLDENWNAKLADMGLSKIGPANQLHTFLFTNVVGTPGYCDPQYMVTYSLTKESDIYSFGVVLFEVLCGRLCLKWTNNHLEVLVPMWKHSYLHKKLDKIIFKDLTPSMDPTSLRTFSDIAFQCLHESREHRPTMSLLVEKLEIALKLQERHEMKPDNDMRITRTYLNALLFKGKRLFLGKKERAEPIQKQAYGSSVSEAEGSGFTEASEGSGVTEANGVSDVTEGKRESVHLDGTEANGGSGVTKANRVNGVTETNKGSGVTEGKRESVHLDGTEENGGSGVTEASGGSGVTEANGVSGVTKVNRVSGVTETNEGSGVTEGKRESVHLDGTEANGGNGVTEANVGSGVTEANRGSGVTEANEGSGVTEANEGSGVTEANEGSDVTEANGVSGVTEANGGSDVTEANEGSGVTEGKRESVHLDGTEANRGSGVTKASRGSGVTEASGGSCVTEANRVSGVTEANEWSEIKEANNEGSGVTDGKRESVPLDGTFRFTLKGWRELVEVMWIGTYGTYYSAKLENGDHVAIIRLKEHYTEIKTRTEDELNFLRKIRHPNLLAMRSYNLDSSLKEKLLIYDYISKESIATFLNAKGPKKRINCATIMRIAKGVARGLHSLHTEHHIIHGHLTSSSVMLNEDILNPKISEYGLSQLIPVSNDINGYQAPELSMLEKADMKSDIYSFGVIMLELLTGKSPREMKDQDLPKWVRSIRQQELINEVFSTEILRYKMLNVLQLAMDCVSKLPHARPDIQLVVQQLEQISVRVMFKL